MRDTTPHPATDETAHLETPREAAEPDFGPGVTRRVVVLSLCLALLFAWVIPVVDYKFFNTFLGATHLPPGALGTLLIFLLIVNPLLHWAGGHEGRALPLLGGALACGLTALGLWLFNVRGAAVLSALHLVFSLALLVGAIASLFLFAATRRALWAVAGVGSFIGAFASYFNNTPAGWSSTIALICWILVAACALFFLAFLLRRPLSRNEVLTIYITCLFSALVVGIGGNNYWVSFIIGAFYFASPENKWMDALKDLPPWMTPALRPDGSYNKALVDGWYGGNGGQVPWLEWLIPLFAWSSLFIATFVLIGSLSVMLRGQWGEREALAFPLMRLPMELTDGMDDKKSPLGTFFQNPLMWVGFSVAVVIQLLNGLNLYFPDVPKVPTDINTGLLFSEPPWNQLGWTVIKVWPIAVGIAYLLTSEISFSLWFFYWFIKFQLVLAYYLGFPPNSLPNQLETGNKAFVGFQDTGAHLAYVAVIFWIGREHFGHIVKRAFKRAPMSEMEKHEAMSYPAAFWCFVGSFAFLVGWTIFAGVAPLLAIALWLGYLVIAIVITRIVAEGGLIFVHHGWMPLGALASVVGAGPNTFLSPANGVVAASVLESACIQDYRGSLMPSFIQSFKLARDRRIEGRKLGLLICAVILVGFVMGVYMNVRLGYDNGGLGLQGWLAQWGPQMTGRQAAAMTKGFSGQDVNIFNLVWLAVGAGITFFVMWCRSLFLWFPLHPLGYMICVAYPMHTFWVSIFIGWLAKVLITRYGGGDAYRRLIPAFLGLALGDVSMMLFWLAIDGWQLRQGHQLMPG
jgi:hypothetical protein